MIVDAIDEAAARFYGRYGFPRFVGKPLSLFMSVSNPLDKSRGFSLKPNSGFLD